MKKQKTFSSLSKIHKLNPTLKFIGFILIIVMVFLPLGFFAQAIIGIFLLSLFFISKLKLKVLWNILKSIIFLFCILLLVNWAFYKDPIAVNYLNFNKFSLFIGNHNLLNISFNNFYYNAEGTIISPIWGGQIGINNNQIFINPNDNIIQEIITQNNISQSSLDNNWNSYNKQMQDSILSLVQNGDINKAKSYLWVINNDWNYNNQLYKTLIIDNADLTKLNQCIVFKTNWYTFSPKAIQLALFVSIKVFLMILAATLLTSTTNSIELTYALENLLSPLKLFRLPVNEASMMIAIALRFIPSLLVESRRIMNAQASRGIDFGNGNFIDKTKSIVSLVVPLFSIAFKKAEDLANAMDARSYNPRYIRTRYRTFNILWMDWLGYLLLAFILGVLIAFSILPTIFTPFGIFELAVLI